MPFLSPDWRCPGEKWIKSMDHGSSWENAKFWREKVFANMNAVALKRIYRQSLTDEKLSTNDFESIMSNIFCFQPHMHLNMNGTREIANISTITEALLKLDMKSAIKDIRRFNYVCRMVNQLLLHRLHTLSGRSQLYVIELLKVIMHQVLGSCNQTLVFRNLLKVLKSSLEVHAYEHMGSSRLWNNHWDALNIMSDTLANFDISKKSANLATKRAIQCNRTGNSSLSVSSDDVETEMISNSLENLPLECLSRIVSNIHSPADLESASSASPVLALAINDEILWKNLTVRNYTPNQIMSVQYGRDSWKANAVSNWKDCNWRRAYIRLLRRYGEQQVHSASLAICEHCSCLYWMLLGHPCYNSDRPPKARTLSPEDFINLFGA